MSDVSPFIYFEIILEQSRAEQMFAFTYSAYSVWSEMVRKQESSEIINFFKVNNISLKIKYKTPLLY